MNRAADGGTEIPLLPEHQDLQVAKPLFQVIAVFLRQHLVCAFDGLEGGANRGKWESSEKAAHPTATSDSRVRIPISCQSGYWEWCPGQDSNLGPID